MLLLMLTVARTHAVLKLSMEEFSSITRAINQVSRYDAAYNLLSALSPTGDPGQCARFSDYTVPVRRVLREAGTIDALAEPPASGYALQTVPKPVENKIV